MWDQLLEVKGPTGSPLAFEIMLTLAGAVVAWITGKANMAKGKNGQAPPAIGEVAGAVIDKQMADALVTALERNTTAQRALLKGVDANTEAMKEAAREAGEVRTDMRDLERGIRLLAAKQ